MAQYVESTALHLSSWLQLLCQFLLQLGLGAKSLPWQPVCSFSFIEPLPLENEQQVMLVALVWFKASKRIALYEIWFQQHRKYRSSEKENGNYSLLYFLDRLISGKGIKRIAVLHLCRKWATCCSDVLSAVCFLPWTSCVSGVVMFSALPLQLADGRRICLSQHRGHVWAEREICASHSRSMSCLA